RSDSFRKGCAPRPILLFQKMRGWLRVRIGRTTPTRAQRKSYIAKNRSIRISAQGHQSRSQKYPQIASKTPIIDIPQIKLDSLLHLMKLSRRTSAPVDLSKSGDARLDVMTKRVTGDQSSVFIIMSDCMGTWSDQ